MNYLPAELEYVILRHVEPRLAARQVCWQWKSAISSMVACVAIHQPSNTSTIDFGFLKDYSSLHSITWASANPPGSLISNLLRSLPSQLTRLNLDDVTLTTTDFEALCHSESASNIEELGLSTRLVGFPALSQHLPKLTALRKLRATPDVFALSHDVFASLSHLESVTIQTNSKSPWDTKITVSASIIKMCTQVQQGSMRRVVASCHAPSTNQLLFTLEGSVDTELPKADCRYIISSRSKAVAQSAQKQIGSLLCLCLWLPSNADVMAIARYQSSKEILKRFLPRVEEKTVTNFKELGAEIAV